MSYLTKFSKHNIEIIKFIINSILSMPNVNIIYQNKSSPPLSVIDLISIHCYMISL